jgi:hypothetical protein
MLRDCGGEAFWSEWEDEVERIGGFFWMEVMRC